MALNVRKKIWMGTLFLFLLISLMAGTGIYYMAKLKTEGKNVLRDNYESLSYCHSMQQQLDSLKENDGQAIKKFEKSLAEQENNITEPGERKATQRLLDGFKQLKSGDTSKGNIQLIEQQLQSILALNMQAIQRKSDLAQKTAEQALAIIIGIGGLVFLIAFTFTFNFPSVITNPINRLTEAIKEIAKKNYQYRIHIDNKDEFGLLADSFNEMAERLEYFENSNLNRILYEKSRAEAIINSLKDASIGIDKDNRILFANQRALELLGLQLEQAVGKRVEDLKTTNDLFAFLIDNENTAPFKIVVDNRENYFIKETIDVAQENAKNRVIVLKNITSYKELDAAKNNFISTISHELKTPLASSDFSLKLLEDKRTGTLSSHQKELIENLKQDNQRMLKILSELLNMSQVEAGHIQLNIQFENPSRIIFRAIETVAVTAKEKRIHIKNGSEENLPMIRADAEKTTWVLNNFLTNAIKYSNEDSEIEIFAKQKNDVVVFSVKDHGPGISQKYKDRIFERYFQVPGAKEKGSGLGLAISKEFIDAQNGKIWVETEPGLGATFNFELKVK